MVTYVKGDATKPIGNGKKIIAHVCNDSGGWGAGFVLAVNKLSPLPRENYRSTYRHWTFNEDLNFIPLGTVDAVNLWDVDNTLYVYNMIAQHGTVSELNPQPLSYAALEIALQQLAFDAKRIGATVHMPRIGCGLARGKWEVVESIINRTLTLAGIDVTVYDL